MIKSGKLTRKSLTAAGPALAANPWFAYGILLLLQLHRLWNIWRYRDISSGDTCSYLHLAWRWLDTGQVNIAWSPLYTTFYALILRFVSDAAVANLLHRVIIVSAATLLVLAVFRRLFPASLAWLLAAWWAILPVNFDEAYEIHIFALIPLLVAWLVCLSGNSPWRRGVALAIFAIDTLLVRNEMILATLCFAAICLAYEARSGGAKLRIRMLIPAYVLPIAGAVLIIAFFYAHSYIRDDAVVAEIRAKHVLSMGQSYAFGYQQRHPEWTKNAMTDYGEVCLRDFGTSEPTFSLMLHRNFPAYARHVLWNISLIPNGLQLMLFSGTSGTRDPDYVGRYLHAFFPIPLTALTLGIVIAGAVLLRRDQALWWPPLTEGKWAGWAAMFSCAVSCVAVILIQRPRPCFVFSLTVLLMAIIGACARIVLSRFAVLPRLRSLMPVVMVAAALGVPGAYHRHKDGRPLYDEYEMLKPFEPLFEERGAVFVGPHPLVTGSYLGRGRTPNIGYEVFDQMPADMDAVEFLSLRHVTLLELNDAAVSAISAKHPASMKAVLNACTSHGWRVLEQAQTHKSILLYHPPRPAD